MSKPDVFEYRITPEMRMSWQEIVDFYQKGVERGLSSCALVLEFSRIAARREDWQSLITVGTHMSIFVYKTLVWRLEDDVIIIGPFDFLHGDGKFAVNHWAKGVSSSEKDAGFTEVAPALSHFEKLLGEKGFIAGASA